MLYNKSLFLIIFKITGATSEYNLREGPRRPIRLQEMLKSPQNLYWKYMHAATPRHVTMKCCE